MMLGELSALAGSCCWAACSTLFTASARRLGIYALNFARLWFALVFLAACLLLWPGASMPREASGSDWFWLALSAVVGLVIGDLFYFGALRSIGPRVTLLLFTLAPPISAVGEWLVYDRGLSRTALLGMAVALCGVVLVITDRKNHRGKPPFKITLTGILLGAAGSFCQGSGLVMSKMGLETVDPLCGTFIRMLVAAPVFAVVYLAMGGGIRPMLKEGRGMYLALWGAFFGPFLGVTLSLVAVKHTHAGIAMTILSTTPITVLPFAVLVYKERLTWRAVLGAIASVVGVGLLFPWDGLFPS